MSRAVPRDAKLIGGHEHMKYAVRYFTFKSELAIAASAIEICITRNLKSNNIRHKHNDKRIQVHITTSMLFN